MSTAFSPRNEAITRRHLLGVTTGATVAGPSLFAALSSSTLAAQPATRPAGKPVKAFCIDFNWGDKGASEPGLYAQADPAAHVRWYQDLGCNTIQTFCVSYNGYAWYPSKVAPVTPGLSRPDWLGDMVELGHKAGMQVMGYFCLGANPHWERLNPGLAHASDSDFIKIPMTLEYLDYFCRVVEDALLRTGVDGFMIDWVRPTQHKRWLPCEKEMWRQLLGEEFPKMSEHASASEPSSGPEHEGGAVAIPKEVILEFDRRAIGRAWRHIRWAVRGTRPAILWTNHPILKQEYPLWDEQPLLQEVDWILNEAPGTEHVAWLEQRIGPKTLIVQNLCGWAGHDASAWKTLDPGKVGFYGFAKADAKTTLPDESNAANAKNIRILRQAYHTL